MGALAQDIQGLPRPLTWLRKFLKHELAPYRGRALTVARIVLAATLVMIICNTFRIPYAFLGGIYALIISRESPRATLTSAVTDTPSDYGWRPRIRINLPSLSSSVFRWFTFFGTSLLSSSRSMRSQ